MMRRTFVIAGIAIALFAIFAGRTQAAPDSATDQVKLVLEKAMEIQTRPDLAGEGQRKERAKLIRQLISENFLSAEMARESIKETWDKLSQAQRNEFQNLFIQLFQDSYTRMVLNSLQKENIEYAGGTPEGKGELVKTVIMRSNEHIPVDYHLSQKNGRWYIDDVTIDGVSTVENYRNSFRRVIQKESFDQLVQKMKLQSQATAD